MAKHMKGITCCGDCAHYDWNKHRCKRGFRKEDDPRVPFFDECDLPDVQPVVHGKWIKNCWSIRCSECGYDMPYTIRNFCPNCGARMDLEDTE